MKLTFYCILSLLLAGHAASAERQREYYSSGSGFFLSAYGDFITNAHVVESCQQGSITLNGAVKSPAALIAIDQQNDLALLRAARGIPNSAQLAAVQSSINIGDSVMLIGYPRDRDNLRDYKVAFARILDVKGPQGEPEWLQFSDSAQQGNSGGPLLDESGNVIGVVTGKTELYSIDSRTRKEQLVQQSDIAVTLPILKRFLTENHIRYSQADSRVRRDNGYIEKRAADFIAQVHCVTGQETLR